MPGVVGTGTGYAIPDSSAKTGVKAKTAVHTAAPAAGPVAPAPPGVQDTGASPDYTASDASAVSAPAPVVAPPPMRDVDWFNADPLYKGEAGRNLADLTSQLAQIMADRDAGYQQVDRTRNDLTRGRTNDLQSSGNDFAGRGLLGSGLFAQYTDKVGADYARQGEDVNNAQQQLSQQYGQQGTPVDLSQLGGLADNGMGNLNSIAGLLGALGVNAGNQYQSNIGQAKAASAGRAAQPLVQSVQW